MRTHGIAATGTLLLALVAGGLSGCCGAHFDNTPWGCVCLGQAAAQGTCTKLSADTEKEINARRDDVAKDRDDLNLQRLKDAERRESELREREAILRAREEALLDRGCLIRPLRAPEGKPGSAPPPEPVGLAPDSGPDLDIDPKAVLAEALRTVRTMDETVGREQQVAWAEVAGRR
jgi:hypothetical protein